MAVLIKAVLLVVSAGRVSAEECPPWFEWVNASDSSGYCVCSQTLTGLIECDQINQRSSLTLASCIFYDSDIDDVVAAPCPYLLPESAGLTLPLPGNLSDLNEFVCGNFSREVRGPLCGQCTGNTGPSVYSVGNQCVPCSPVNVLYYLLLQYLPITVMFLVVLLLRLNLTAAPMAHYVLFCNVVVFFCRFGLILYTELYGTSNTFIVVLVKILITLSAVWSFDALFFIAPSICITNSLEDIYLPFLEFFATLYPFLLLLLTYIAIQLHIRNSRPIVTLWKPFHRVYVMFYRTWDPNASMMQAFSSLLFLSYAKINFFILQTWFWAVVVTKEGVVSRCFVYIDPNVPCLSNKHIYMIIFSAFVVIFLYSPPVFLLLIYPTSLYRKISDKMIRPRWRIGIKTYVETFQGCFKDGADGTRDYRAVSGYLMVIPGFIFLLDFFAQAIASYKIAQHLNAIMLLVLVILCSMLQPYKRRIANVSAVAVLSILATDFALSTGLSHQNESDPIRVTIIIVTFTPHCALAVYMLWKMKNIFTACYRRCKNDESWWLFGHGNNYNIVQ